MAAWTPSKAPCSSSTTLPPPPSSAGVPSTISSTPRSSASPARATPTPAAMAAITLCPQAWPISGSASYSAQTTTRTSRSPAPSTRARVACFASLAIGCTLPERAARDHDGAIGVVPGDQRRRLAVPPPPQRHVGADVRVGQVLDRLEGTAAALLQPAQLAGEQAARVQPQRRGRRGQPAQQLPQGAQPLPALRP